MISCSYYTLVSAHDFLSQIDLTRVSLVPYDQISRDTVAFDHADIIMYAHQRLKWKMEYTNIIQAILPEKFTLRALQDMYENILKRPFDKRNFRKKVLSLDMLIETDEWDKENSKRPAKLYRFSGKELKIIGII